MKFVENYKLLTANYELQRASRQSLHKKPEGVLLHCQNKKKELRPEHVFEFVSFASIFVFHELAFPQFFEAHGDRADERGEYHRQLRSRIMPHPETYLGQSEAKDYNPKKLAAFLDACAKELESEKSSDIIASNVTADVENNIIAVEEKGNTNFCSIVL